MLLHPPLSTLFPYTSLNGSPPDETYTLSLHDALPICSMTPVVRFRTMMPRVWPSTTTRSDRKSTRLNSSHLGISYAVFCLKKKIQSLTNLVCRILLEKKKQKLR